MPAGKSGSHVPLWRRGLAWVFYLRGTTFRFWGNWLHDLRNYQRAVDEFSRALRLNPGMVDTLYSRGVLYWRELRNAYRAIQDLTLVMELSPGWAEAWFNRAQAHQLRGDYDLAIADLEQYLTISKDESWRINAQTQLTLLRELQAEKQARPEKS